MAGAASFFRVSGKMKHPSRKLSAQMPAATAPGPASPKCLNDCDPMTGPKMKPKPKAMPMRPMPLERFSGVVTSAI